MRNGVRGLRRVRPRHLGRPTQAGIALALARKEGRPMPTRQNVECDPGKLPFL
jgi:hypothetical protein